MDVIVFYTYALRNALVVVNNYTGIVVEKCPVFTFIGDALLLLSFPVCGPHFMAL